MNQLGVRGVDAGQLDEEEEKLQKKEEFFWSKNDSIVLTFHTLMQQRGRINIWIKLHEFKWELILTDILIDILTDNLFHFHIQFIQMLS
jgi:hypothetical protein